MTTDEIRSRIEGVKPKAGGGHMGRCPAHEDRKQSLSIDTDPETGKTLLHCFAGCELEAIVAELGIWKSDLFDDSGGSFVGSTPRTKTTAKTKRTPKAFSTPKNTIATYRYHNVDLRVALHVWRLEPKTFLQGVPDEYARPRDAVPAPGCFWPPTSIEGFQAPLYRLEDVIAAIEVGAPVHLPEGEKDADAIRKAGAVATTSPGGADSFQGWHADQLAGAHVIVLADRDEAGYRRALDVVGKLAGKAASVVVRQAAEGKDAADHLAAGRGLDEFEEINLDKLRVLAGELDAEVVEQGDLLSHRSLMSQPPAGAGAWPEPLGVDAYHGLFGELVRRNDPHTEADPAAVLVQALAMLGSIVGPTPHWMAESTRQPGILFPVIVADTSKGRKGSSQGGIKRVFSEVDPVWFSDCVKSGLSSGEGLAYAVRDKRLDGDKVVDEGVVEKRLLADESEFGGVLKVASREGSTLSAQLRHAWDGAKKAVLTRRDPIVATGAHVSLIGHITSVELKALLTGVDAANGLGNRILWCCAKRSKMLPDGGAFHSEHVDDLVAGFKAAVAFGRRAGMFVRDEAARDLWHAVYPDLSRGDPGLFGAVTSRAEAQVMRVAMLYAIADCSAVVQVEHLRAALEVWRYCRDSARAIFGDRTGNPVADRILDALRGAGSEGLSRTEIRDLFQKHKGAAAIDEALGVLLEARRVRIVKQGTAGRPVERVVLTSDISD